MFISRINKALIWRTVGSFHCVPTRDQLFDESGSLCANKPFNSSYDLLLVQTSTYKHGKLFALTQKIEKFFFLTYQRIKTHTNWQFLFRFLPINSYSMDFFIFENNLRETIDSSIFSSRMANEVQSISNVTKDQKWRSIVWQEHMP